jgi:hypothetical protein
MARQRSGAVGQGDKGLRKLCVASTVSSRATAGAVMSFAVSARKLAHWHDRA